MKNSSNTFQTKILLISCFFLFLSNLNAQTTVYSNSFNTAENPFGPLNAGTPAMTWTNVTTGAGIVRTVNLPTGTNNNLLNITNNASAAGRTYTYGNLSNFSNPFQKTLSANSADISWSFNMRTSRNSSSIGFDVTNGYGSAVVLCATSSNFLTANGYAVTLMRGTTYNAVRLVKFTGGLISNANLTTIIGPSPESTVYTDYYSVKVIYSPSANTWKLFSRIDGIFVVDPELGPYTRVGTETADNTYTNTPMSYFGFLFNHQTTTNYYACFDNFKVIHAPDTIFKNDTTTKEVIIHTNLRYGDVNNTSNLDHVLDLYVPNKTITGKIPTLVFIHGGAFLGGDKGGVADLCTNISKKGFAVISMNYTLTPSLSSTPGSGCGANMSDGLPPNGLFHPLLEQAIITASNDAILVLDWIKTNANTYNFDTNNVSISGGSAGSMTALYTAYSSKQTVLPIRSVIDLWGGLENAAVIESNSPPVITFHGDMDTIINVAYAYAIHNRLADLHKTNSSLNIMVGKGHAEYSYIATNKVDQIAAFMTANKYVEPTQLLNTNNDNFKIRNINGGLRILADNAEIKVIDTLGKIYNCSKVINNQDIAINKKGCYIIQVKTNKNINTVKFIVQ
ncbi:MAG TPA: T9SS type A sorting domain-containing protein [Paludibacter sp.]